MYMTDFAYDGPIFLVPMSPSYPSSPVPTVHSSVYVTQIFFRLYGGGGGGGGGGSTWIDSAMQEE